MPQGDEPDERITHAQAAALLSCHPSNVAKLVKNGRLDSTGMRGPGVGTLDLAQVLQYPAQSLKSETSRTAVPIPQSLALELSTHVGRSADGFYLANEWGQQLAPWTLERAMRSSRAKVPGLPPGFRFQDLRHYLASLLIASGADVKVVQARLRHASATTTLNTYSHL